MRTTGLKIFFIIGWLLGSLTYGWAESLVELQEKAVSNRKMIEKYRLNARKGELDVRIARSYFMPSLDLNYVANSLDEQSPFESRENSSFTGIISYNIFSGFRDKYNLDSAEFLQQATDFELNSVIQDIKYQVAARYLEIYARKNTLDVSENEYKLLKKRHDDSKSRYGVGLIKKNDLLKIKVELDDAEQRLKRANAEFSKSINQMAFEIDAPINASGLTFREFDALPELKSYIYYETLMMDQRNEIKALQMVMQAREKGVSSAKSAYYPSVDVSASIRNYGDNYWLGSGDMDEDEKRLQLTVNMNLFDGFKKYDVIKKAKMDVRSVESDIEELKNELRTQLKNILLDYEVGLKNLKVAESSISQAEENLRITDISYKEGVETAADVLDAIFYLSRAKSNFINARNEVFLDYYRLLRITDTF